MIKEQRRQIAKKNRGNLEEFHLLKCKFLQSKYLKMDEERENDEFSRHNFRRFRCFFPFF